MSLQYKNTRILSLSLKFTCKTKKLWVELYVVKKIFLISPFVMAFSLKNIFCWKKIWSHLLQKILWWYVHSFQINSNFSTVHFCIKSWIRSSLFSHTWNMSPKSIKSPVYIKTLQTKFFFSFWYSITSVFFFILRTFFFYQKTLIFEHLENILNAFFCSILHTKVDSWLKSTRL